MGYRKQVTTLSPLAQEVTEREESCVCPGEERGSRKSSQLTMRPQCVLSPGYTCMETPTLPTWHEATEGD